MDPYTWVLVVFVFVGHASSETQYSFAGDLTGCIVQPPALPKNTHARRTRVECSIACLVAGCLAFNYYKDTGVCELHATKDSSDNFYRVDATFKAGACQSYRRKDSNFLIGCSNPFTYLRSEHICVHVIPSKMDWATAHATCNSLYTRSHLVVIDSSAKDSKLQVYMSSIMSSVIYPSCGAVWIAGHRYDGICPSSFYWKPYSATTSWTPISYSKFASGEPTCSGGAENSLEMASNFFWNDISASATNCPYCEITL